MVFDCGAHPAPKCIGGVAEGAGPSLASPCINNALSNRGSPLDNPAQTIKGTAPHRPEPAATAADPGAPK